MVSRRRCPECGFGHSETAGKPGDWIRSCSKCGRIVQAETKKKLEDRFYSLVKADSHDRNVTDLKAKETQVNMQPVVPKVDQFIVLDGSKQTVAESSIRQFIKLGMKLVEESDFCFVTGAKRPLFKSQIWFDLKALSFKHDIILKVNGIQFMSDAEGHWQKQSKQFMNHGPKFTPEYMLNMISSGKRAAVYGLSDSVYDDALLVECIASSCQDWRFCIGRPGQKDFKK